MTEIQLIYSCFILFGVFISAIAQVMLKNAANKHHSSFLKEYLNPLVIFAYLLFFASTLLSVYAYKEVPLSFGPILEATSYIYITLFGVFIFKEKFTVKSFIAVFIIVFGIIIYTFLG